jgi:site-specific DNA-cytosine methylase
VEQDEGAIKVVMANHSDLGSRLVIVRDVADITAEQVKAFRGFHLVIGGSPCQDFSFQGNLNGGDRAGLEGDRGKLVYAPNPGSSPMLSTY